MKRVFFVKLNLDEMGSDLFRFTDDKSMADYLRGLNVGARGYEPTQGASQPWMAGHSFGIKCFVEANEYHEKKSQLGKKGADARWLSHASAMPQPCLSDGLAMPQPCLSDGLENNEQLTTNNHQKTEKTEKQLLGAEVSAQKVSRFVIPSVSEVDAYCQERGNGISGQAFVDFYTARGWMVGKSKMKDWRAAVRTWEARRNQPQPLPQRIQAQADDGPETMEKRAKRIASYGSFGMTEEQLREVMKKNDDRRAKEAMDAMRGQA